MTTTNEQQVNNNKWRQRFIILCSVNIIGLISIFIFLYSPVPEKDLQLKERQQSEDSSSEFVIRTTKENLNNLVNAYLDKLLSGTNHHYSVHLDNDVQLFGELPIFSTTVPLLVRLEPIVLENGDVTLKQRSISVGPLQLPNKKIMQYIDRLLPTPEWVIINPKEEEIYVKVTDMDIKSNFDVSVEQFDLEGNNIAFKINVPYKTLGIDVVKDLE